MERKSFDSPFEIKQDGEGKVRAVISVFNVVDSHGDVTVPGCFPDGKEVDILWQHDRWELPVGQGVISQDDEKAYIDGQFFLETTRGHDAFMVVKSNGNRREWSYAYDVNESHEGPFSESDQRVVRFLDDLDVFEASPVLIGSNRQTETLLAKDGLPADAIVIAPSMKFADHADAALAAALGFTERVEALQSLRSADGRKLSATHLQTVDDLIVRLTAIKTAPAPQEDPHAAGEVVQALAAAATARARLTGMNAS